MQAVITVATMRESDAYTIANFVPSKTLMYRAAMGVYQAAQWKGPVGILTGGLTAAAAGVTTSLVCGVVCSWVGKSHDQN